MDPRLKKQLLMTRRYFFGRTATGIGTGALASSHPESRKLLGNKD